ncbi:MAG: alanine--tRNA ligase [Alphaproteobacteria bacterium]|nr:alanine--tRNA ligase [Alphaproteobacteria bacterium]
MQTTNDIRSTFLDYFAGHDHTVVPSSPLVPRNDPTLLFTNAGMVQFKNVFTGVETRDYSRAASSQKCVRAGGKHSDLERVGHTARHHTFFEMLGNFSFGDYFKDAAIELAWGLLTGVFGIDKQRLWVTVYHEDDEARRLWKKIAGLPDERIVRIATADNFWMMGDTGPCGPCSEIFYDHGDKIPGGPPGSAGEEGDRFVEIWNLVFMQYDQVAPDERNPLPKPSIDTGMGLERITAVLQGVHDNYETDAFRTLIQASADATGTAPDGPHAIPHRVIADHLRASVFLIADGVLPSNEGRGYVLRRILRRAMRQGHLIGCREPLLWRLIPTLVGQMGQAYPELIRAEALVTETLKLEESRFQQTLERGLKLLAEETAKLKAGAPLPGDVAFRLYDTYGFPVDLTEEALKTEGREVDLVGFEQAMARQREEARASWTGSGETQTEAVWFGVRDRSGATEFLGYDTDQAEGMVVAIFRNGEEVNEAGKGDDIQLVTNQTPFYGESGGQMGDSGLLTASATGLEIAVQDTQKKLGVLHVHLGKVKKGKVRVGEVLEMQIDTVRRTRLRANHSATHLLHEALRRALGKHVTQKGSLVAPDRLRFDISHPKALTPAEIQTVEAEVNRKVRENSEVETRLMTPDEAVAAGALALFGEKYADEVRVLSMGREGKASFSVELCGGTHVRRTGDIGFFKIVGESAIGAGVRRIEALTGVDAEVYVADEEKSLQEAAASLKVAPGELAARVENLIEERRRLERELQEARRNLARGGGDAEKGGDVRDIDGCKYLPRMLSGVPAKELRPMADDLKKQVGSGVVAIVGVDEENKVSIVVGVTADLTDRLNAVELVKAGSAAMGGQGGGGRPDMAQGGGADSTKGAAALEAVAEAIAART